MIGIPSESTSHAEDPDAVDDKLEQVHRWRAEQAAAAEAPSVASFLLARIAEDEAIVGEPPRGGWREWAPIYSESRNRLESTHDGLIVDPARVLAECAAKRAIVGLHGPDFGADACDEYEKWPCFTIRYLALPYADHPDFDPAWRLEP